MLKLHHMNLLNEIQETTLMMNLYQQQQLQQQQQQLQAQANAEMANDPSLAMMIQGGAGGLEMFAGQLSQRGSLGLGAPLGGGGFGNAQLQLIQQQQAQQQVQQAQQQVQQAQQQARLQPLVQSTENVMSSSTGLPSNDLEGRIAQLKQDIAKNDEEPSSEKKRPTENPTVEAKSKKAKKTDDEPGDKQKGKKPKADTDE
jgi:type II secretory pathway pseudopilin PulG